MAKTVKSPRPTLAMIAKVCGVSNATVSRVLSGDNRNGFSVRDEVRQKIMDAVAQMNYRPDLTARSLRAQETHVIAVLGLNHQWKGKSDVNNAGISAAVDVLHDLGYSVCTSFPKPNQPNGQLPPWRVDGYLLVGIQTAESLAEIEASNIPYVGINTRVGDKGYACQVDDTLGIEKAVEFLVSKGHQRIAYRNGSADRSRPDSHAIMDRHTAFLQQIKSRRFDRLKNHDSMVMSDVDFLKQALQQNASAILAYDLTEAIRILQAAYQLHIRVPDDLSLICFNDNS